VEVHSLQDTQRALRLIRSRAADWGVDAARLGVMGFSAGGELAALASMRFDNGIEGAADATVYLAFKKVGVPAELHIYAGAGHGFGLRASNRTPVATWPERFKDWLADRGFLGKS
jgi:acetyl esterase/lipase